jgi:hypothetical protein
MSRLCLRHKLAVLLTVLCGLFLQAQADDLTALSIVTVTAQSKPLHEEGLSAKDPGLKSWYKKCRSKGLPIKQIEAEIQTSLENTRVTLTTTFNAETGKWNREPDIDVQQPAPISFTYPVTSSYTAHTFSSEIRIMSSSTSLETSSLEPTESGITSSATYLLDLMVRIINTEKKEQSGKLIRKTYSMETEGNYELKDVTIRVQVTQ